VGTQNRGSLVPVSTSTPPNRRNHTIQKLVYQYKVVLDGLLIEFAEVAFSERDEAVKKLEYKRGIGIAFGHGDQIDIFVLDMGERRRPQRQDWGAHLRVRDHLDTKDIGEAWATWKQQPMRVSAV
jgi:hypothetical protein